jgi:S1-C subfamily serine protease
MDILSPILRSLLDRQTIERPACGFSSVPTSAIAAASVPTDGLLVGAGPGDNAIAAKGPADTAGLKAGDRIVAVDKASLSDWSTVLQRAHPGQKISVTVVRDKAEKTLSLTFGTLQP